MNDQPESSSNQGMSTWQAIVGDKALLLAFITGSGYLVGYAYFRSYYQRFGIPPYSINIPTLEIFYTSAIYTLLMMMVLLPAGVSFKEKPTTFMGAAIGNLYLLISLAICLYGAITTKNYLLIFASVLLIPTFISMCRKRHSLMHFLANLKTGSEIAFLIVIVWVAFQFSSFLGAEHATRTIEGKIDTSPILRIYKNNENILPDANNYRMIYYDQNGYYLVKTQIPAPKSPSIVYIPRNDSLRLELKLSE